MHDIKEILDAKVLEYETVNFIADDPIAIPHTFTKKEDIEISAFLASTIAWGNRKAIVKKGHEMMTFLENDPYNFTMHASEAELKQTEKYVYRTFQQTDLRGLLLGLRNIYDNGGMERIFALSQDIYSGIANLRREILPHLDPRTHRHIADVTKGSAGKRINLFLRWMVRRGPVDFGLWTSIQPSQLMLPLDVHSAHTSRELGLLTRKQNDWRAVEEVTANLRLLDPEDPIKYDFALFGLGIYRIGRKILQNSTTKRFISTETN